MIPYLLILFFVSTWIILERMALHRRAFFIPLLTLALFAGLRSYRVGTDTGNYVANYIDKLEPSSYKFSDDVEKGFQLFDYLLLQHTHNYAWLLLITSFFCVFSYLKFIKKYAENYLLSVIIYITFGFYTFFFNGLRQGIAMAIMLYAITSMLENKFWHYLLICFIASRFHISALFMIPFYFVVNLEFKTINKLIFVAFGSIILSSKIVHYMAKDNIRYKDYVTTNDDFGGIYTLIFYVLIALFILIINTKIKIKNDVFDKLFTLYLSGIALLLPIASLGAGASGPQRLIYYFVWTLIIILPMVIGRLKGVFIKLMFVSFCIIYYYLTTMRFSNLTPYIFNKSNELF